ncbi:hypothetical protein C3489_10175 [Streptomyces sp. Ru71]|uniref:hypothetical protein n=1 Tax=Streptomyces sp. Ru71 TaxID=2080746 RepID=UPI000CDE1A89|nr:hypothetical protein [Streptomyces sp. Ru71]POX55409.1 hypothetical protein C3489_10175 [Streptomyces sp. Ru71]
MSDLDRILRAVLAPLGGLVEIGAVQAAGDDVRLADVSVGEFLAARRHDLDSVLGGVRSLLQAGDHLAAVADQLGYFREHEVTGASLLLWSGGIAGVPDDPELLGEPGLVRRMCRIGADLQLTAFLHELVTAAITVGEGGERVVGALRGAARLVGGEPAHVHRMWRVAHLARILEPRSDAPGWGRAAYRACDLVLEGLLQGDSPPRV